MWKNYQQKFAAGLYRYGSGFSYGFKRKEKNWRSEKQGFLFFVSIIWTWSEETYDVIFSIFENELLWMSNFAEVSNGTVHSTGTRAIQ